MRDGLMELKLTMAEIRRKDIRIGDTLVVEPTSDGNVCLRVLLRRRPKKLEIINPPDFEGIKTVKISGSKTGGNGTYRLVQQSDKP